MKIPRAQPTSRGNTTSICTTHMPVSLFVDTSGFYALLVGRERDHRTVIVRRADDPQR